MNTIQVRPTVERHSVHPSITEEQIADLVDSFYSQILGHARLGEIFKHHIADDWDNHLDKMKAFWRSVLLRTGEYKGKPVPAHQKIDGVETADFEIWLRLFSDVTARIFTAEAAILVNEAAQRIASSLWLARSSDPFANPPIWSKIMTADQSPTGT